MKRIGALLLVIFGLACGGAPPAPEVVERAVGRKLALWVRSDFSRDDAERAKNVGFDEIVVYRGLIDISAGTPVLRLVDGPDLGSDFVQTPVLGLKTGVSGPGRKDAEILWRALAGALGSVPSGMILDVRNIPKGLGDFFKELQHVSGGPVIPLLGVNQLSDEEARRVAVQAGECVVPLYGAAGPGFRSSAVETRLTLRKTLAPLASTGVRIRVGIGLEPRMDPDLKSWGGDPDLLMSELADSVKPTHLDRAYVFRKDCSWGGRNWTGGERIEARWMDVSRMARAFRESDRMILPELSGWDLFGFPPQGRVMGLNREALLAFMVGRGPAPEVSVIPQRRGRSLKIRVVNTSPFASAVSKQGHWLEVSTPEGSLVVRSGGSFDAVVLGSLRSGRWKAGMSDRVDAVRFFEDYLGSGEELETGTILLPSSRTKFSIKFRILLSDGSELRR